MKKIFALSLIFLLIKLTTLNAADNYSLTSFYPAPAGKYVSIELIPQATITPSTNCPLGTLYVDRDNGSELYYCAPGLLPPPQYVPFQGVWTLSSNSIYPKGTPSLVAADRISQKVAIGTTIPIFKLTLNNDGGIVTIDDQVGTLTTLTTTGAGTRFIYYPLKNAFRAGYINGTQWDNGNIGNYSVALGSNNRASAIGSTILGGSDHLASASNTDILGGRNNQATGTNAYVLGGESNIASGNTAHSAGFTNNASNTYSSINGGANNTSSGVASTVLGGSNNSANQNYAVAAGGFNNTASGNYAMVAGGRANTASGANAVVLGGQTNTASGNNSLVSGGYGNRATHPNTIVNGGNQNESKSNNSIIVGGDSNVVTYDVTAPDLNRGFILGGQSNTVNLRISSFTSTQITAGGSSNFNKAPFSFIAGRNMGLSSLNGGTFLWGYSGSAITPISTADDAFIIYSGKVGIRDTDPAAIVEINGNGNTDDYLALTSSQAATITAGNRFIIKNNGNVGVNGVTNPGNILRFANGAYVDNSGRFRDSSSRKYKENISNLSLNQARDIFSQLQPVRYNYINQKDEEFVGFIAEDVPAAVADHERQGIFALDIAAVLTKITQDQEKILAEEKQTIELLLKETDDLARQLQIKAKIK